MSAGPRGWIFLQRRDIAGFGLTSGIKVLVDITHVGTGWSPFSAQRSESWLYRYNERSMLPLPPNVTRTARRRTE